ncbi:MAG: AAA family ATPase, partial [Halioglobus sp.]
MTDLFFSYASEDRERVRPLVSLFEELGHTVWWDRRIDAGREFDRAIETAIETAGCIVVCWSAAAVESDWVRTEAMEGMDRKILVPVQLDATRPPLAFRRIQTSQLIGWPEAPCTEELARMQASVKLLLNARDPGLVQREQEISGRRNISHLSARVTGLEQAMADLQPEDFEILLNQIRGQVESRVHRYGGILNQFTGSMIQAVFGVPVTHENDAYRSICAARALVELFAAERDFRELGLGLSAGVATGQVIAHGMNREDRSFNLLGGCTEVSTGLAYGSRGGAVRVCGKTRRLTDRYFEFQACGAAGDVSEVVDTISQRPTLIGNNTHHLSAFSGREPELSLLEQALERAEEGTGQAISVVGEAGAGKSRLLREFQMRINEGAVRVLTGRCHSNGAASVFEPVRQALSDALRIDPGAAGYDQRSVVSAMTEIDPALAGHVPACLRILGDDAGEYELPQHLDASGIQMALRQGFSALINAMASRQAILLIFDDWHWADRMSDDIVSHLVKSCAENPLLLVVVHRPEYSPGWQGQVNCSQIKLHALSRGSSSAVLKSVLDVADVPDALVRLLHARTGGNPFFLEEVARALLEEGHIRINGQALEVAGDVDALDVPDSVQAVIRSRLDQLDPLSSRVLNRASVFGREFPHGLLAEITPPGEPLELTLKLLVSTGLIQQIASLPEPRYKFNHVLTQSVAYNSMLGSEVRDTHERIALAFERLHGTNLEPHVDRLALHFDRAGNQAKAVEYLIRAGHRARRLSACTEAVNAFNRALQLLAEQEETAEIKRQQLEIYLALAQELIVTEGYASARLLQAFDAAQRLSREIGTEKRFFPTLWGRWRMEYNIAEFPQALKTAQELRDIALRAGDENFLAGANTALAVTHYWLGNLRATHDYSDQVMAVKTDEYWQSHGYLFGVQPAVMNLAFRQSALIASGQIASGVALGRQIDAGLDAIDHLPSLVLACFYRGINAAQVGDHGGAQGFFDRVIHIADTGHFPHWHALAELH